MPDFTNAVIILPMGPGGLIHLAQRLPGIRLAGYYATPGGKIEPGEGPAQAAQRELREEAALEPEPWRLRYIGRHTGIAPDGAEAGGFFFLLHLLPGERLANAEPDKHTPWAPVPLARAATLPLFPPLEGLIRTLAAGAASVEAA